MVKILHGSKAHSILVPDIFETITIEPITSGDGGIRNKFYLVRKE